MNQTLEDFGLSIHETTCEASVAKGRYPDASFPLDGCDIETVSEERLLELFSQAPTLSESATTKIVRLSQTLVMKGGRGVLPSEAKNMEFAARLGCIRVPKVWRSFTRPFLPDNSADDEGYIVMDYLEGSSLKESWPGMAEERRHAVVTQVAAMIRTMQSTPLEFIGPVGGGKSTGMFFTDRGAGPFDDRKAMQDWFNHKLEVCKERFPAQDMEPFLFDTFVFVHGCIASCNIILDERGSACLIDWKTAGSYPPQFEAAAAERNWRRDGFSERLLMEMTWDKEKVHQLTSIGDALRTRASLETPVTKTEPSSSN